MIERDSWWWDESAIVTGFLELDGLFEISLPSIWGWTVKPALMRDGSRL